MTQNQYFAVTWIYKDLLLCPKNNFVGLLHIRQIYENIKFTCLRVIQACHYNYMSLQCFTIIFKRFHNFYTPLLFCLLVSGGISSSSASSHE